MQQQQFASQCLLLLPGAASLPEAACSCMSGGGGGGGSSALTTWCWLVGSAVALVADRTKYCTAPHFPPPPRQAAIHSHAAAQAAMHLHWGVLLHLHNAWHCYWTTPAAALAAIWWSLQGYLAAKRQRMDHLLDGSWCYWNHDGEPTQPSAVAHSEGGMGLPAGMQAAKANSTSPALASHTVQMDEDEDDGSSSSSNEQVLLVNGSAASSIRLSRKSSSSGSSTAGGGSA